MAEGKITRLKQSKVPSVSLDNALRVPIALRDNYACGPTTPLNVAGALGMQPTTGKFRTVAGAAVAYGLTEGGPNAQSIAVTELGKRIVTPKVEGDDVIAMREAFERPEVSGAFIERYNGHRLPSATIAVNVLEELGVPRDKAEGVFERLRTDMESLGYLKDIKGTNYVQRPAGTPASLVPATDSEDDSLDADVHDPAVQELHDDTTDGAVGERRPAEPAAQQSSAIFIGHGKNKEPMKQLQAILNEYGIPFKTAISEPNAGRPIPVKVAEVMRECGAAILVFTADQELMTPDGVTIWRPSENVVHELGAASVLYGDRIIIFKEESVNLASNFSSIGYINFEKDRLSDKGIELIRELMAFKVIQITVPGT